MLLFAFPGNERMAGTLAAGLGSETGAAELHRFPDGESRVRIDSDVRGRDVGIVATMRRPDEMLVRLLLLAETARDLGARRVGLVAPYLAYMRQDTRFRPGEGVTSRYVAALLSRAFKWLVTVDPHLHRHRTLADLYTIPAAAVRAAPAVSAYIRARYPNGVVVGPDSESKQWVADVARLADVPFTVLHKERTGDHAVTVSFPDVLAFGTRTPIVLDDIVASGATMCAVGAHLRRAGAAAPVCIGIHALFDAATESAMRGSGFAEIITCNTVEHATNRIDVSALIAEAIRALRV